MRIEDGFGLKEFELFCFRCWMLKSKRMNRRRIEEEIKLKELDGKGVDVRKERSLERKQLSFLLSLASSSLKPSFFFDSFSILLFLLLIELSHSQSASLINVKSQASIEPFRISSRRTASLHLQTSQSFPASSNPFNVQELE